MSNRFSPVRLNGSRSVRGLPADYVPFPDCYLSRACFMGHEFWQEDPKERNMEFMYALFLLAPLALVGCGLAFIG